MVNFEYSASVIIPIYNSEAFLERTILSLVHQTINFSDIEILLINDGSTDNSEIICKKYSGFYKNVKYFKKENEGLSKTRNYGLKRCNGKYIFFLDADDEFSESTIKAVINFFEKNYDETDLVTFRIIQYLNNVPVLLHYRYEILNKSGIYDLNLPENYNINQTNVNICIKNIENPVFFDETPYFKHEDLKYSCDILSKKMKIGFCDVGEYKYHRDNALSIVNSEIIPEITTEKSLDFYENLIRSFPSGLPAYFQSVIFNELRWQFQYNRLVPTNTDLDIYESIQERIDDILCYIDIDIIIRHPTATEFQLAYWLRRKPNVSSSVIISEESYFICINGRSYFSNNYFRYQFTENRLIIKSILFMFINVKRITIFNDGYKIETLKLPEIYDGTFIPEKSELIIENVFSVNNLRFLIDGTEFPLFKI